MCHLSLQQKDLPVISLKHRPLNKATMVSLLGIKDREKDFRGQSTIEIVNFRIRHSLIHPLNIAALNDCIFEQGITG